MEHPKKLEELNKEALNKFDEYIKAKDGLKQEDHEKLHKAKEEWQIAWNKFLEVLVVLERVEL